MSGSLQAALVEVQHVEDNPLGGALEGVVVPADLERADGDTLRHAPLLQKLMHALLRKPCSSSAYWTPAM